MKVALLGDIALFGDNTINNKDYQKKFGAVKEILDSCDYIIGNLETPLTNYNKTVGGKSAYIKGTPSDVEILKYLNVSHVSLANNHMFDYRSYGLDETKRVLNDMNIQWYGVEEKTCSISDSDTRVELMGYCCYSTNGKGMGVINVLDPIIVEKGIKAKKDSLPIISIHWGQEHVHYPNIDHIQLARKLCNGKRLVIHGHHPHVIQGIEYIGDSLIAYSLGNFCFDDVYTNKSKEPLISLSKANQEALILVLTINNNNVLNIEKIPFSFASGVYKLDKTIIENICKWSDFLKENEEEYVKTRNEELSNYLNKRKELRNIQWYLKRLNVQSVKMIMASKENMRQYNRLVKSYIEKG